METHKNENNSKLRRITNNAANIDVVKLTRKKKARKKEKEEGGRELQLM
jgi:hypothetical protein